MVLWVQQTQPTSLVRKSRRGREYASLESKCLDLERMCEKQSKEKEELKLMVLSSQQQSSHSMSREPASQHCSYSEHRSQPPAQQQPHTHQFSTILHQPTPQQQSSSPHVDYAQQHMSRPHFNPSQFLSSSSQLCYPSYRPSFYPQMAYPVGEFTSMLNGNEFTREVPPLANNQNGGFSMADFSQQGFHQRNNQSGEFTSMLSGIESMPQVEPLRNNQTAEN